MESYDLQIYQGASYSQSVNITGDNGNPIDLTSYQTSGYVKPRYSWTGAPVSLNVTIQNPTSSGVISFTISGSVTKTMPVGIAIYDVFISSGSVSSKVLDGRAYINPGVSF